MLGKLIKHEFTATGRILSILFAVLLVISPITAIYMKFRTTSILPEHNTFLNILEVLCGAAFTIAMIAAGVATVIVLLSRFYQSMVTRESYLTHTLPVTTSQLVISKLIVAFIWQITGIIVMFISLRIFIGILGGWNEFSRVFTEMFRFTKDEMNFNFGTYTLLAVSLLVSIIVAYLKCYASFALGHLVNGHSFIGFIVSYIAISTVTQIITALAVTIFQFAYNYIVIDSYGSLGKYFSITMAATLLFNIV